MARDLGGDRAAQLLIAILSVSESLLVVADEAGFLSMPNHWRVSSTLQRLLETIAPPDREVALRSAVMEARGVPTALHLLRWIRGDLPHGTHMEGLEPSVMAELQSEVAEQAMLMSLSDLLDFDEQQLLIRPLIDIVGEQRVRELYQPILSDPAMLLRYLEASASRGMAHPNSDRVSSSTINVSSRVLDPIVERERATVLVDALRQLPDISREQVGIIDAYFQEDDWHSSDSDDE